MQLEDLPPRLQEQVKRKLELLDSKSKYHANKREIDGHTFDSIAEAQHYASLKLLERAGVISDLQLQPKYLLQEGFVSLGHRERAIHYIADFQYVRSGKTVIEDVKGMKTEVYKLKRKLFLYKYKDLFDAGEWEFKEIWEDK